MRDLTTLSNEELEDFFNSFDHVLSDVDGVLWTFFDQIPGTAAAIKSLQDLGKKIIVVSNNTLKTFDFFWNQLKSAGFNVEMGDIVTPVLPMISYLKKQNLANQKIFVLGMPPLVNLLAEAGFEICENSRSYAISLHDLASCAVLDDDSVGCVISDIDLNLNYISLQKAVTFLKKPGVVFLVGATDLEVPVAKNCNIVGPGHFHKILESLTGKSALKTAKPSPLMNEYIVEKFQIEDPSRVLLIGDSIPEDMGLAAGCNYTKLLVLSGLTKRESLESWPFPEELKPDFYVESLGVLQELLARIQLV